MRLSTLAIFTCLLLLAAGQAAATELPPQERAALIALYNATGGDAWTNNTGWKTPPLHTDGFALPGTENDWYGVDVSQGHVIKINIGNNNLTGQLPPEIGLFPNLTELGFPSNALSGSLPAELGNLTSLNYIVITSNNLTGPVPATLGNLAQLKGLFLSYNDLTGPIPAPLGQLIALEELDLGYNNLSGTLPSELGNLAALEDLSLGGNAFTGSLPAFIGNLSQLEQLSLSGSELAGPLPAEWGGLHELRGVNLSQNPIGGAFPPQIFQWTKVRNLNLSYCQLTGSVPPELGGLSLLSNLNLSHNQLGGSIPPELGSLASLTALYLDYNQLSGAVPPELANLANLAVLQASHNSLSGSIPASFGGLAKLETLEFSYNGLEGNLPGEIGQMAALKRILLTYNHIGGSIPDTLGNLANLTKLDLSYNQLQGNIPASIGNLVNLDTLTLASNKLQGMVPDTLLNLTQLTSYGLSLAYNALYSDNPDLRAFYSAHANGFDLLITQTLAPADIAVQCTGGDAQLQWTPIVFNYNPGAYRVWRWGNNYFDYVGQPTDKYATGFPLDSVVPGVPYSFIVDTFTEPHESNDNWVYSYTSSPIEFTCGSFLPAQTVYFPRQTFVPGAWTEGYGFYNPGGDDAGVRFTRYRSDGQAMNTAGPMAWYAGEQAAYQIDGVFGLGGSATGWVAAEVNQRGLLGYFLTQHFTEAGLVGLDGAGVFTAGMDNGYFPRVCNVGTPSTDITLANPGNSAVTVVLTGLDGDQVYTATPGIIHPHGCLKIDPARTFGVEFDGAIEVESSGPVIGNALIRDGDASIASVNLMPVSGGAQKLYAAHIVRFPGVYYCLLNLVNPNGASMKAKVTFYLADGTQPMTHKMFDIPAGQVRVITDAEIGLPADENVEGWLLVETQNGPLLGCLTFGNPADNHYMSTLPLQAVGENDFHYVQVVSGNVGGVNYFTGLAVVNPNDTPVDITISVHTPSGALNGNAVTRTLAPREKYVRLIKQIEGIGALADQSSGFLHVTTNGPEVVSFLMFGDDALNFLSAVPAQSAPTR